MSTAPEFSRSRLVRLIGNAWTWVLIAGAIRFAALFLLPYQGNLMLDRASARSAATGRTHGLRDAVAFLQRRTDFRPLTVDEHCYDEMGQNVLGGRGFVLDSVFVVTSPGQPAMYAGCGYPLFLAGVYLLGGNGNQLPVFAVQILMQALAVWFVFHAAARVAGPAAGVGASGFFALHPVLIWCSAAVMTEAILIPGAALLGWLLLDRGSSGSGPWKGLRRPAALGLLLALLCLTRSTCFGFVLVATAAVLWEARRRPGLRQKLAPGLVLLLVFSITCAPWTIRNYAHWRRWIPFSTKSGVNAWFFNHPGLRAEFSRRAVEGPQPIDIYDPRIQGLPDEAARDARLMELFKQFVREDPGKFVGLCYIRFWLALLPVRITSDTASASLSAWYAKGTVAALLAGAVVGAVFRCWRWRRLAWRIWPLILLACYWQAIQTLAGPGMRYRLPVEPTWAILAGVLGGLWLTWLFPQRLGFPLARRWIGFPQMHRRRGSG